MENLVLYCKSYARDVLRVKRLLDSIDCYNQDNIPVYISAPREDRPLFESTLGKYRYELLDDESIVALSPGADTVSLAKLPGGHSQQIIKSEFWRLNIARNYLCVDSDSYFITEFKRKNFLHKNDEPYTVMHQNKELLQMAANRNISKVKKGLQEESYRFEKLFNRGGPDYSFMPSPFLWSAEVWQSLEKNLLQPKGITLWQAVTADMPESMWYGEALLAYQAIPLWPVEPYFRVYHYDWQYYWLKRMGESESKLAKNYLGVVYQSNWDISMDYGVPHKPLYSRLWKRTKSFARRLQAR